MDQLRTFLVNAAGDDAKQVYTQPPTGMQMVFPCLVINIETGKSEFADNTVYRHQKRYLVTAIVRESDDLTLYDILSKLPKSRHERSFKADELNHHVFSIFYDDQEATA